MKKLNLLALAMLVGLISAPAWAASPRTFVSATRGNDQGNCSIMFPCLTFNFAISQTSAGGEVIAVDSGNYAPATITTSVTIEAAPGVYVGITPVGPLGEGVTVNGIAGAVVVLRGLTIYGGGLNGINFNSGAALTVEKCVINGLFRGILHSAGNLFVKDTVIRNCTSVGVALNPSASHASLSHVWLENGGDGIDADGGVATISNSVISGNSGYGIIVRGGVEANVEGCQIANNVDDGIRAMFGTARVSSSTVTDNSGSAFANDGGTFDTFGNNTVAGNGSPNSGTITPLPPS